MHLLSQQPPPVQSACYVEVLLDLDIPTLSEQTYTYAVPDSLHDVVTVGTPILVGFGARPMVTGYVLSVFQQRPEGESFTIREITDVLDELPLFDAAYLTYLQWISDYYGSSLNEVLQCALPADMLGKIRKEIHPGEAFSSDALNAMSLGRFQPMDQRVLQFLKKKPTGVTPRYLAGQLKTTLKDLNQVMARLKQQAMIRVHTSVRQAPAPKVLRVIRRLKSEAKTPKQQAILDLLAEHNDCMPQKDVPASSALIKNLIEQGAVVAEDQTVIRDPLAYLQSQSDAVRHFDLSAGQQQVVDAVLATAAQPRATAEPLLLHGVTGAGKTEVYMTLTEETLKEGRSALILVPEIALTSQIAKRFTERFGVDNIALWHSNLSDGERIDTWRRMMQGELKIVIGARSAVFAPLQKLGLIIMDEQHGGSYKQESPAPRYHARTLAEYRACQSGARLLLGSATPDVADFYQARKAGRVLRLLERFGNRQLAEVRIVDMRDERARKRQMGVVSESLLHELTVNLERKEQSLVLINRRGYYTLIQCQECNTSFRCPACDVSLTYHRTNQCVCCHHCGYTGQLPAFCPHCASPRILQTGTGTQRVEEEMKKQFPDATIMRLDSDVLQRKDMYREVIETFTRGEGDILIGTQMVAKGLDIANVTLVGVVNADSSFYLPDYRSSERGFQLLTQVAGRAGRGEKPGRVVLQSMEPGHPVLRFSQDQDYDAFFDYELAVRQNHLFPPFSQLFRFIVIGEDDIKTRQYAQAFCEHLRQQIQTHPESDARELDKYMLILGPSPCVISRIQRQFRYHCLIKNNAGSIGHELLTTFRRSLKIPEGLRVILDVDSQSLL